MFGAKSSSKIYTIHIAHPMVQNHHWKQSHNIQLRLFKERFSPTMLRAWYVPICRSDLPVKSAHNSNLPGDYPHETKLCSSHFLLHPRSSIQPLRQLHLLSTGACNRGGCARALCIFVCRASTSNVAHRRFSICICSRAFSIRFTPCAILNARLDCYDVLWCSSKCKSAPVDISATCRWRCFALRNSILWAIVLTLLLLSLCYFLALV